MSEVVIQLIIIFLFNGLLAMSEIAIITFRKPRLEQAKERGDSRAEVVLV